MDKLKKFLAILNKYQFWAICGVMLLIAMVCWWMATYGLAAQFRQREGKLKGDFSKVIVPQGHPNQGVIKAIETKHEQLKRGVYDAWEILYREQKEKNQLPKVLGEDFKRQFENLKPQEELIFEYRELYLNFILKHLPALMKMIDMRRPADETLDRVENEAGKAGIDKPAGIRPSRRRGNIEGMVGGKDQRDKDKEEEWVGIVEWNEKDYEAIESRFRWRATPSTLAILLAQEDLWVYEALLRIIKDTNEGATYATAPVKRIEALEIAQSAVQAWRDAEESVVRIGQTTGGDDSPARIARGEGMSMESGGVAGADENSAQQQQLFHGRYVDDKGKPLPSTPTYPYVQHPYAEFKMMPIRMSLIMDQRKIPQLLVECANSNMPIEVRRVRIRKTTSSPIDLASASQTGSETRTQHRADYGESRREPGGMKQGKEEEAGRFDVPIEIHGVIYIYNPPDRKKLGTGTASQEKTVEPPAAGVAPPAAPAPGAPATPPAGAAVPGAAPAEAARPAVPPAATPNP